MVDTNLPPHKRLAAWWVVDNVIVSHYLSQIPSCNYLLVSYEQMSLHPIETAEKIYNFLGRSTVPLQVHKWLLENTKSYHQEDKEKQGGRYGTSRDSEIMAYIWKGRLTSKMIQEVEEIGGPLFHMFNYTSMQLSIDKESAIKATNDVQKSLTTMANTTNSEEKAIVVSKIYRRPSKQY